MPSERLCEACSALVRGRCSPCGIQPGKGLSSTWSPVGDAWGGRTRHVACALIRLVYGMYRTSEITGVAPEAGNDGCGQGKSLSTHRREGQQCRPQWCSLTPCSSRIIVSLEVKKCLQFHDIVVASSKVLFSVSLCPTSAGAHNMLRLKRLEDNVTTPSRKTRPPR